jgi:hypothetical protein
MIKEFAEWLDLTIWDWIAVSVSLCSLMVAILSFVIARLTLKSQRQTEKNTMPIINIDIQQFLLDEFILRLLDGHIRLTALWYVLEKENYSKYPSEQILKKIQIPIDTIHTELFYNNPSHYRMMQGLLDMIKNYNIGIDVLNTHLKDSSIEKGLLYNEMYNTLKSNDRIADMWGKVMTLLFKYSASQTSSVFEVFIKNIKDEPNEDNLNLKYYRKDEVYATFFDNDIKRNKILLFMESSTISLMEEFSKYLIDK